MISEGNGDKSITVNEKEGRQKRKFKDQRIQDQVHKITTVTKGTKGIDN